MRVALLAALLAGCTTFEDPSIVLDLRVIAITANPPEQLVDVDDRITSADAILDQLQTVTMVSIAWDPLTARPLSYTMRACLAGEDGRCDPDEPSYVIASGVATYPLFTKLTPDLQLLALLQAALVRDPLHGFGGIDFAVELEIGDQDADPATYRYAVKHLRISPRLPADRTPNQNPRFPDLLLGSDASGQSAPPTHCGQGAPPVIVAPGQTVTMYPVEPPGTREVYDAPTIDGTFVELTETISYQWLATAGSFSDEITGGPHDAFGNVKDLGSDWTAPSRDQVLGPTQVSVWVVQRDERYGASWFETCMLVVP